MPKGRGRSNRLSSFFIGWACARRFGDTQCGMRVYPAGLWRRLRLSKRERTGFVFETAVILHAADLGVAIRSVPIPAVYGGGRRPSHFRPVGDFVAIGGAIARFLASRWFRPRGLLIVLGLLR